MRSLNHAFSHSYSSPMNGGRGKKMILYGPENLEKLLESLFADNDELDKDIVVFGRPVPFILSAECCNYSYTGYGE